MNSVTLVAPDSTYDFTIGDDSSLCLILGPCVIESREHLLRHASGIVAMISEYPNLKLVFKSSYDKANRTSGAGFRGLGIDEGLSLLEEVRKEFNVPVITDVHSPEDVKSAASVVDILQIPAFLCRQTDLLVAAGSTGKTTLIKKGQFLHPSDMKFAAEKVKLSGSENILLCERGACFGYRDLVVDFRSFSIMRDAGFPVVFDATHAVQVMGGASGSSSGNREYVPALARAALAFGVDGLFLECHESPETAPSDGPNMLPLEVLPNVLKTLSRYWHLRTSLVSEGVLDTRYAIVSS
jgi:2-dehydro-3-deoxyphosphooctonate aldolase (KDO 8-P synthase)